MTESVIRNSLFAHFEKLNEFSGAEFITENNVHYPNKRFEIPEDKSFFELSFLPSEPYPLAMGENSQNEWNGVLQIDVGVPLDVGTDEIDDKKEWIYKLFARGTNIDKIVDIKKVYSPTEGSAGEYYNVVIRVEWVAVIDN